MSIFSNTKLKSDLQKNKALSFKSIMSDHLVVKTGRKLYNRAGVLLVDISSKYPSIILFQHRWIGTFSETCGRIDNDSSVSKMCVVDENTCQTGIDSVNIILSETAARELREESANVFKMSSDILKRSPFIDTDIDGKLVRTFVLAVDLTNLDISKMYNQNHNLLENSRAPSFWLETSAISQFYVNDVINTVKKVDLERNNEYINIDGEKRRIWSVTAKILYNCFVSQKMYQLPLHKCVLERYVGESEYLAGTMTAVIQ
jgi:hypothetical protein